MSKNKQNKRISTSKNELVEYFKYFKESDPDLRVKEKYVATSGLNPFVRYNSSPRGLMMSSHISQALTLTNPDKQIVFTGMEREMGKYSITKEMPVDGEVITIVKRYKENIIGKPPVEYTIIYRNLDTGEIDVMEIPNYNKFHPYFGFEYHIDKDYIENLFTGDVIPKGKILAWPSTYDPETGDYGYGKNLNVAFMTLDGVAEDGFIISKSALKKLQFQLFESRSVNLGSETYPLNIYGDDENFKAFPELFETVNDTGAVMAVRRYDEMLTPSLTSKTDMKTFNPIFDNVVYARGEGGKVIDIKVFKSFKKKKMLPKDTDQQLEKYSEALLDYYRSIISVYENLEKQHSVSEVNIGKKFNRLIVEAYNVVNSTKDKSRIKKTYRKEEMDLYYIDFVVEYTITPTIGYKLSGYHGNKGVIVRVWEDEDMPMDEDGNRAELIMDPSSIVSRLNVGVMYERYFAATSRRAKKLLIDKIKEITNSEPTEELINSLDDNTVLNLFKEYVLDLVKILENKQSEIYEQAYANKDIPAMRDVIKEIVFEEFYLHYTVEDFKEAWEIVLDIEESKFRPPYGPVKYRENGIEYTTRKPVMIAPMYMLLLNKIADGLLSTSSAKVNHFGLPIGVSKIDKYRLPWKNNPVRNLGETEARLIAAYGGRELLAELKDRGSSIETHTKVYRSILESDKPTNISKCVDRQKHPFGTDKALDNLMTLFNSSGLDLKFVEDKNRFYDPIDNVETTKVDIDEVDVDNTVDDDDSED